MHESGAKSTDMEAPEDVNDLCSKTAGAAEKWAAMAESLWAENPKSHEGETCAASQAE